MNPDNNSDHECNHFNLNNNLDFFKFAKNTGDIRDIVTEKNIRCEYYNESSFSNSFINCNNLICISANVQSLASKFTSICDFFDSLQSKDVVPDLFAIQEVWKVNISSFNIPNFSLFSKIRKKGQGGGVGLYINNKFSSKILESSSVFVENIYESLAVQVETPDRKKFIAVSMYRPNRHTTLTQSEQIEQFFTIFTSHLSELSELSLPVYIFSDTNIDLMKAGNNQNSNRLLDLTLSQGFLQIISKVTRIQGQSATLLDHIFSNDLNLNNVSAGVILDSFSDHFSTFTTINFERPKILQSGTLTRNFNLINKRNFKDALLNQSWSNVTDCVCPNIAYSNFWDTFSYLFDVCFPLKLTKRNKKSHPINPFMTPGLLISRNNKLRLYKLTKSSPTPENTKKFNEYRNLYNKVLRKGKQLYFQRKIQESGNNSKKLWTVINEATNSNKSKTSNVESILVNDILVMDEQIIADSFNDFFSQVGAKTTKNVPSTSSSFKDFLPPPCAQSLFLYPVVENQIIETLNGMDKKTSVDINDISVKFLNEFSSEVAIPLAFIYNLSVQNGMFPDGMKISKTIPVFKNVDSRLDMNNYRPISIVNCFSKIFEKLIANDLLSFLLSTNFFYKDQFGFLEGRSTSQAIVKIINHISKAVNNGETTIAVLLDVQKAFDSVNHQILLSKLENAGIRGIALDLLKSFISNRKQKVRIGSKISSNTADITIGVLQGSILGVLLFLVYINDLGFCSDVLFSVIFADDITSLSSDSDFDNLVLKVNVELRKLSRWYRANKLAVHPKKSEFMIFRPNNTTIQTNFSIVFDDNDIGENDPLKISNIKQITNFTEKNFIKVLGVRIDEKLTLDKHVNHICAKISTGIYNLNRVKNIIDTKYLKMIYFAHIHSHLNYCSLIFTLIPKKLTDRISKLQKKAVRAVCKKGYRDHTSPLFLSTKILPFRDLILYNILNFMKDFKNKTLPQTFNLTWLENSELENQYNLRNASDYYTSRLRYQYLKDHPLYFFPKSWNELHFNLKYEPRKNQFSKKLKLFLLHKLEEGFSEDCACQLCFVNI